MKSSPRTPTMMRSPPPRPDRIHNLVNTRLQTLYNLRQFYATRTPYLNVYLPSTIPRAPATPIFHLANSLSAILSLRIPDHYLQNLNTLLKEWESYISTLPCSQSPTFSSPSKPQGPQNRGFLSRIQNLFSGSPSARRDRRSRDRETEFKNGATGFSPLLFSEEQSSNRSFLNFELESFLNIDLESFPAPPVKTEQERGKEYSFSFLRVEMLPFEICYIQTVLGLCDMLVEVYSRLLTFLDGDIDGEDAEVVDLAVEVDRRIGGVVKGIFNAVEDECMEGIGRELAAVEAVALCGL
ncbi:hypothetical protein RUND412_007169 [Rhizina undulata]